MRIGKMRYRVTIQRNMPVRDDFGQPADNWTDVATVWADVRFSSGKEFIAADKETASADASIRIRKRAVTTDMRVVFEDEPYDIVAVLPALDSIDLAVRRVT